MRDDDTLRGLDEQEQAARKAQEDAEKAKVAYHFRGRIEQQLTAELRKALHLTLAGTAATFQLNGRVFTVTWHWHYQPITAGPRGREKEVRIVEGWDISTPGEKGARVEGPLQAGLLEYLASLGYV